MREVTAGAATAIRSKVPAARDRSAPDTVHANDHTGIMERSVLVGVDGSAESLAAVELGVREARLHGLPLRVVHAFFWPLLGVNVRSVPDWPLDGGLAADADRLLAEALAHASAADPDLRVTGDVVTGSPVPVLLAEANHAELVVLGDRGLGGFTGLLVGSVAVQFAAHAPCPLLVARGTPRTEGPIVLGVDGSPVSDRAVEFGFAEAQARGAELVAVRTWHGRLPGRTEAELPLIYDMDDVQDELARELAGSVAAARSRYPKVAVRERVWYGRAAQTLVHASAGAQLIVVGARGRGGFAGLLLGSVSQQVLHHADCPVAIVNTGKHPDPSGPHRADTDAGG
jgi:nucleotide-binding universal stress UspA family protein